MAQQESVISLANGRMTIIEACAEVGSDISDFTYGSIKTYCPFGSVFHMDGGTSKTFRVYPDTNTAHCFAGCGFFTPTRLLAKALDIPETDAAESILMKTNYVAPDYLSRWEAATATGTEVDRDGLSEALIVACLRMDKDWEIKQFDDSVSSSLRRVLGLLPKVNTSDDATRWLSVAKEFMRRALGEHHG